MRVAVLGAGVIGVTSAWYLSKAGHEVVVIDRQPGPALETSFANAGEVTPSYATPWAAPGIPLKAIKWLFQRHAPLIVRPGKIDASMLRWMGAMLGNCTNARFAINRDRMQRLAVYSRQQLIALREETGIAYDARQMGTLQLCHSQSEIDDMAADVPTLNSYGLGCELLDRAACLRVEPGLKSSRTAFVGGVRMPDDETGDCHKFTTLLAALATDMGVCFENGRNIIGLRTEGGRISAVETDRGAVAADAYLVAMGSYTSALLRPLGIAVPIYPVKGYSITAEIIDEDHAPLSTLLDSDLKVAVTRLGDRIRVGGLAELADFATDLPERRRLTLNLALERLFPGGGDIANASFWTGLRPMTPDSTPVVGATAISNLFVNAGHGTMGWTMACGSGRVIADVISGKRSDIRIDDLALARYRGK